EQEYDILQDGGQIYDNRDNETWTYAAVDGIQITSEDEYLKSIKIYLSAGLPVIIDVGGHFVVVVGVESDIKLEKAEFKDLVIYDPGRSDVNQIVTLGKSEKKYKRGSFRLLTPYPVVKSAAPDDDGYYPDIYGTDILDSEWSFVKDEKGKKTHDPYYLAPVRKTNNGKIIPAKQGRPLKEAIKAVNYYYSDMPEDEKEEIIKGLKKVFTGEDEDAVYKDLVITENGEYEPDEDVTAFKKVTVDVKANVKSKSITANGVYKAVNDNAEGFDVVNVNVPDNGDDMERYNLLWLKANGDGETVETDIPKPGDSEDPENPDNPGGGGNYVFENAVDVGSQEDLDKYTPMFKKVKTINIVETGGGLALHLERIYNGNRIDVKLTVTNLKNGKSTSGDSCFRTPLDIRHNGCEYLGIAIHNGMVSAYYKSDFAFSVDTWLSEIDFHAPANWNRHFILV
ncbi:MAG: hypothetical protein K2N72_14160, partial [Oscillospiraceae bacterium]|nr:hypothetical protein [Oscillospiraceae bacterium]